MNVSLELAFTSVKCHNYHPKQTAIFGILNVARCVEVAIMTISLEEFRHLRSRSLTAVHLATAVNKCGLIYRTVSNIVVEQNATSERQHPILVMANGIQISICDVWCGLPHSMGYEVNDAKEVPDTAISHRLSEFCLLDSLFSDIKKYCCHHHYGAKACSVTGQFRTLIYRKLCFFGNFAFDLAPVLRSATFSNQTFSSPIYTVGIHNPTYLNPLDDVLRFVASLISVASRCWPTRQCGKVAQ
eukprot:scaffold1054_cov124-Cylindrotheca_fusiformis.AAC.21